MIHVFQVHKESIDAVPHSKKGRDSFELEIFGMVGVPSDLIQEKMVKIYGEPAIKKQKVDHHVQPGMARIQFPGISVTNQQMMPMQMPFMYRGVQPGVPGMMTMGRGMPIMPLQRLQPQMMRPQQGQPMIPGQHAPQMIRAPQMMQPRNPVLFSQKAMPTRPGQPMQHLHGPPLRQAPNIRQLQSMQQPAPQQPQLQPPVQQGVQLGTMPQIPPQQPQQVQMRPPNQLPPQAHAAPPPPMPHPLPNQPQPMQPGMMPKIHQTPISNAAKTDVVERADQLVNQQSVVKKTNKKKINRIYEEVNVSMEEQRAVHPRYVLG